MKRAPQSERAAIEARLLEVQRNLEEHKRVLELYAVAKERMMPYLIPDTTEDEARVRAEKEKMEVAQRLEGKDRKARLIYHTEATYPPDAREKKIEGSVGTELYGQSRRDASEY
jgi:hypothetical protein